MKNNLLSFLMISMVCSVLFLSKIHAQTPMLNHKTTSNTKMKMYVPKVIVQVPNFLPSKHGLNFTNSFPIKEWTVLAPSEFPLLGIDDDNDGYGLCGGMSHVVNEFFVFKQQIPNRTTIPNTSEAFFHYLAEAQFETFGKTGDKLKQIKEWYDMPGGKEQLPALTFSQLWALKVKIKRQQLVQLILMYRTEKEGNIWENHQVLAYGYEEADNKGSLMIYDPNKPNVDTMRIYYTIRDKKVLMTYSQSIDPKRKVHGFFITFPALTNPNHNPLYVASLSKEAFIRWMKEQGKTALETAKQLEKYYKVNAGQIARLLQRSGYECYDVGLVLLKQYRQTAKQTAVLLYKARYSPEDIAIVLKRLYNNSADEVVVLLKHINQSSVEIAKSLVTAFNYAPQKIVAILKNKGFPLTDIGDVIVTGLNIKNGYDAMTILKQSNYSSTDIAKVLKIKYKSSYKTLAKAFHQRLKFSAYDTGMALYKTYNLRAEQLASELYNTANYDLEDCKNAVQKIFNLSWNDVANLF